jgi:predicted outer membrane repeat protein
VNATPGSSTVTLSALELEPNETCFVKVNVVGTASGTYNTTTSPISSTQTGLAGVSNLASLNVNSNAQVVSGSFNPNVVTVGTPSTLTFQITAGVLDVTGVGFTDTLPPGLKVAPSPQITNSCDTQGSVNALANATQITIAGVGKALPGTCSISVKVVGTRTGNFNNLTGAITSNTGTGSPVSTGILSVIGSPTVNVGLAPRTIGIGKQTRITYTITNPNSERPLTNVGFNVTLPMNVAVSSEPDLENSCSLAGSNTVTPSTQTYSFSGIGLNPAEVCDISFNFVVSNAGSYTVSMSTVTSTEVGLGAPGNPVSIAVLTPPTFVQTFMPSIVKVGDASTLTYTITNPNATTLTEGTFENILPDGLLIASPNGLNLTNCGTGSAIGVSGTNLISTQDLQIVTAGPCVITVNVVGSEPGIYRNEPEGLQTDQTGIGAPPTPINLRVARYDCTIGGLDTAITNGGDATFACTSNTTLGITAVRNFATSTTIDGAGFLTLKNEIDAGQPPKDSKGATATPIRPNARDGRTFGAFGIESGATVRFTGLTFENGNHPTIPPLISSGTLYLTNVTFRNNTISGALLINSGSTATIINSTFENNMVNTSDGAAIYADSASTLTVVNSTFNGNSAPGWSGGAIYVVGGATVNLINSTIANNSADVAGGVYVEGGATFTLTNTVFSNNSGDNCAGPGTITNNGGNIQYPGITCGAAITTADPLLGSLTNNGGQTLTMALGVGSPAINAGVLSVCATNPVRAVDQRGRIRALDLTCDSGAFEYNAPLPTFSISAPTTIGAGVDFNVTVTALDSTDNTVTGYTGIVGLTSNDGAAVLPIARAYTPDDYGSYTFSVRLNTLGARTVTATDQTDLFNAVANITVLANPTVGLAFAPSAISTNGITTLTYTLSNPNAATALSGIQFTNTMPSQLAVAADPFLGGSCTTSFFSATPGSQTITVQGVTLPASGSCTLTVNVTSATNGEWLNQVNTITSLQTGTGSGSSPVALAVGPAAPTVSASFLNSTINRLNATALTYTVTNPNATALTNVSFSHTLPTQITVFTPFTMTNTCSTAGSVTGSGTLITITGVGLTGAESCTITVYVMSNTVGTWNTQTGIITATENANGAASGTISLTVNQARVDTIGVYRSANRTFYLRNSNTTGAPDITVAYQSVNPASDRPITGDWNNDTVDTIGVYDTSEGVFYLRDSNTAGVPNYAFVLGNPNDMPLAGHWASDMSGDGVGVYRSSNGVLYLKKTLVTGVADYFAILGNPGDIGIAGDWDGDGLDTAGVYRPSNSWMYLINNPTPSGIVFSDQSFIFGDGATDTPFVGDIVGQGRSAYAVRRGNSMIGEAKIFVENNIGSYPQWVFSYGDIGDTPLLGHWTIGATPSLLNGIVIQGPPVLNDEGGRAD